MCSFVLSDNVFTLIDRYYRSILIPLGAGRYKPKLKLVDYIIRVFDESLENTDEDSNQSLEMMHMDQEQIDQLDKIEAMWKENEKQKSPGKKGKQTGKKEEEKGVKRPASNDDSDNNELSRNDSIDYKADTP